MSLPLRDDSSSSTTSFTLTEPHHQDMSDLVEFNSTDLTITTTTAAPDTPQVEFLDDGTSYGYQCARVVQDNDPIMVPMDFFFDLSFPQGAEKAAVRYVQTTLVQRIAREYGISNAQGCENPSFGKTWLIQILSQIQNWQRDSVLKSCKELPFDSSTEDCFAYQAQIQGGVLAGDGRDILGFASNTLQSPDFVRNSPYQVKFLGVPVMDPSNGGDAGRNNLGTPSNINQGDTATVPPTSNNTNFTVVGGLLVAAFCLAFVGIGMIFYRRRQQWLQDRELALEEYESKRAGTHPDDDDEDYGSNELRADLYQKDDTEGHLQMDMSGQVVRKTSTEESADDDHHQNNHPNVTFDLGNTFKNQLMGVYGTSAPKQQQHFQMYGAGRATSMDSEADSWAQTDGTIGSIEQNLEPITAEV